MNESIIAASNFKKEDCLTFKVAMVGHLKWKLCKCILDS